MADDLRQQIGVVPVVVHLAKIGREHAGRLVPDLTGHAPFPRVAGPDMKDLVGQIARADPLPVDERPAKRVVHPGRDGLGRRARPVHASRVHDVRQDPAMHEHLAVFEVGRLDAEAWMSVGVKRRLPDLGHKR